MRRQRTDIWYIEQIGALVEEGLGAPTITKRLEEAARSGKPPRTDWPSASVVDREVKKHKGLSPEERKQQGRFKWPETMELGLLPWEASRALLDFARYCAESGPFTPEPSIRLCKWFWRVRLAAPDMAIARASELAKDLAAREFVRNAGSGAVTMEGLTLYVAFTPWQSEENKRAYLDTLSRLGLKPLAVPTSQGDVLPVRVSTHEAEVALLSEHYDMENAQEMMNSGEEDSNSGTR